MADSCSVWVNVKCAEINLGRFPLSELLSSHHISTHFVGCATGCGRMIERTSNVFWGKIFQFSSKALWGRKWRYSLIRSGIMCNCCRSMRLYSVMLNWYICAIVQWCSTEFILHQIGFCWCELFGEDGIQAAWLVSNFMRVVDVSVTIEYWVWELLNKTKSSNKRYIVCVTQIRFSRKWLFLANCLVIGERTSLLGGVELRMHNQCIFQSAFVSPHSPHVDVLCN